MEVDSTSLAQGKSSPPGSSIQLWISLGNKILGHIEPASQGFHNNILGHNQPAPKIYPRSKSPVFHKSRSRLSCSEIQEDTVAVPPPAQSSRSLKNPRCRIRRRRRSAAHFGRRSKSQHHTPIRSLESRKRSLDGSPFPQANLQGSARQMHRGLVMMLCCSVIQRHTPQVSMPSLHKTSLDPCTPRWCLPNNSAHEGMPAAKQRADSSGYQKDPRCRTRFRRQSEARFEQSSMSRNRTLSRSLASRKRNLDGIPCPRSSLQDSTTSCCRPPETTSCCNTTLPRTQWAMPPPTCSMFPDPHILSKCCSPRFHTDP